MASVGEKLRREREIRGMTIEQVAEATGVSVVYLGAMERSEFDALPGRAFGKLYIRAYADVLDFDPRPLIEGYDLDRRPDRTEALESPRSAPAGSRPVAEAIARWKAGRTIAEETTAVEPPTGHDVTPPVEIAPAIESAAVATEAVATEAVATEAVDLDERAHDIETGGRKFTRRTTLAIAGCVVVAVVIAAVIYLGVRKTGTPATATTVPAVPSEPQRVPPAREIAEAPLPSAPAAATTAAPAEAPGALTVSEFGIGRRVVDRRLEGESDRFAEGDAVVFQTRVLGGRRGDRIRHVWIHDGRAQQSIELRLGGADWRTHTSKTVYRSGTWTVEARGGDGRVLASATFTCVPRNR